MNSLNAEDTRKLVEEMRETALKNKHAIEGDITNFKIAPAICHKRAVVMGVEVDLMFTLNVAEKDILFWQLSIYSADEKTAPPPAIIELLCGLFFGWHVRKSEGMEITHLLPPEMKPHCCRQFIMRYNDSMLEATFGPTKNVRDLSPDDEARKEGMRSEVMFTAMVAFLRNPLDLPQPVWPKTPGRFKPHKAINDLCSLFYDLVGNRVTPCAMTNTVKTLHFWSEIRAKKKPVAGQPIKDALKVGVVMCPINFSSMVQEDLHFMMGGIVFSASKARDYWNDRLISSDDVKGAVKRAQAYEAEYLNTLIGLGDFNPNPYQRQVMAEFPNGLRSLDPSLQYESLPFSLERSLEFADVTKGRWAGVASGEEE